MESQINPQLKQYIETEILPKYEHAAGHNIAHIHYVINRSLYFAEQAGNVNIDMVYVIAAYHDLGRLLDDDLHEKISAHFALIDNHLKKFFTKDEIQIIAEAIEDHRASNAAEPRSIYGKIVSTADRTTSVNAAITRPIESHLQHHPERSFDENIENARQHVLKKYSEQGYAINKIYFDDPEFQKFLQEIRKIIADHDTYKNRYIELTKSVDEA